jgi:hypothetical protein
MESVPNTPPVDNANGSTPVWWFRLDQRIVREFGEGIGPIGIALYACLASYADEGGLCYPSCGTLAKNLGVTRQTIISYVAKLESAGLLRAEKRRGQRNFFRILLIPDKRWWSTSLTGSANGRAGGCQPGLQVGVNGVDRGVNDVNTHLSTSLTLTIPIKQDPINKTQLTSCGPEVAKKSSQEKPPRKTRPRDDLFDTIAEVTGAEPTLNGSEIGKVCAALRKADPPFTTADVRRLVEIMPNEMPWFEGRITIGMIQKHIGRVRATPVQSPSPSRKDQHHGRGNPTKYSFDASVPANNPAV